MEFQTRLHSASSCTSKVEARIYAESRIEYAPSFDLRRVMARDAVETVPWMRNSDIVWTSLQ